MATATSSRVGERRSGTDGISSSLLAARSRWRFPAVSLQTQAWVVSGALLLLTGLLGAKAYQVAHTHYREMSELANPDLSQKAHETALGLYRLILWALLLSGAVTTWLLHLFFNGLVHPIRALKDATHRIGGGDLSCRMQTGSGLEELRELSRSFNGMAERLQQLDRAKTEFLAMISHEIKNPLAALKEGLNLLSAHNDTLTPQARAKGFAACLIASKRLESMINNLLQHSRMEAGFFRKDMAVRDLHFALQTAMDEVRPLAEKRHIRFGFEPERGGSLTACFSADGMIQVFENLLLNAIKYGTENSVIEIRTGRAARRIHVEIANSGPGIAELDISRVFERFYRGPNPAAAGAGLGLHVVKTIVEAHSGEVTVQSAAGRTAFLVSIPAGA